MRRLIFLAALLGVWAILGQFGLWDPTLFPTPWRVVETFWRLMQQGELPLAAATSLRRVLVGYGLSLLIGVPIGMLAARSKLVDDTLGSTIGALQALPSICWLPMALLWFGLNDRAILFVVVMGSLVSIAATVKDGVRNLPPTYQKAALTLGVRPLAMLIAVLLPASLPTILIGAKLGWSYAWRALMSGELLFVSLGLGHILMMGRELADMSQVLCVMGVIMAIGLVSESLVFGSVERLVRRRWGLLPASS